MASLWCQVKREPAMVISLRCALWVNGQKKVDDFAAAFLCWAFECEAAMAISGELSVALLCCPVEWEPAMNISMSMQSRRYFGERRTL